MVHNDTRISLLYSQIEDAMLNYSEVVTEELMKYLEKEKKVATICDLTKIKKHSRDNRLYVYINRKQYIAPTRKLLIEKLYKEFFGINMSTLREVYLLFMQRRIDNCDVGKTTKEYRDFWNRFLENNPIANMTMCDITLNDLDDFFSKVTSNRDIRVKTYTNLKTLLNQLFDFAMMNLQIINDSPIRRIDSKKFRRRCLPTQKREGYTNEERLLIKNYLKNYNDMYSLAIRFAFDTYLRIGELSSIKVNDIIENNVKIHFAQRRIVEVSKDLKTTTNTHLVEERLKSDEPGKTYFLPLTHEQEEIVAYIKEHYPNNEFLFMERGKPIIGETFNNHLKRVCDTLGITYHSSHCIRFTNATYLSSQGVPISDISSLLNHTKVTTTSLYINVNKVSPTTMELSRHLLA